MKVNQGKYIKTLYIFLKYHSTYSGIMHSSMLMFYTCATIGVYFEQMSCSTFLWFNHIKLRECLWTHDADKINL